jgi:nucleolar protein 9
MDADQLLALAGDATSSRVIDAMIDSETVPRGAKRKIILAFMPCYQQLAQDKIGSRVAERCWGCADVFARVSKCGHPLAGSNPSFFDLLQEKIARILVEHEESLMQSYYGKFFARTVNLPLFRRDPRKWKVSQQSS